LVLNNVLDLSKIEAGELIVENAPFNLRSLLTELVDMTSAQAGAKGIGLSMDVPDHLPRMLEGDAGRLTQILINLMSNAVKFTDHGTVMLKVLPLAVTPSCVSLCFVVQDTGIGISPEVQQRLFTPFSQADPSITRRFGGTGLGLSIVKRLTQLMGGEVSLESTPGLGSAFKVVLDFVPAPLEVAAALKTTSLSPVEQALIGVCVLVVDDSDINLEVTKRILESKGAKVLLANNGQEAFDLLDAQPQAVDVVLMDLQMPVLDGHDATRRIRRELKLLELPIIALTAGALSSELQRSAAAGMDDYLVKPFDAQSLVASILRHIASVGGPLARPRGEVHPTKLDSTPRWLEIEGIDSINARERLNGDFALFRSMLQRLLSEFADVSIPQAARDTATLKAHAGRMHKLKGSAGMLGATAIRRLADEAETACAAGEAQPSMLLATQLAAELQRLRQCSELALMGASTQVKGAS
jgi:CheY-like chemotaxis protein